MAVALYLDVHVPLAIAEQLRRRGVDVLTAIEDGFDRKPDDEVLQRATHLGRVVFTQDIRFKALAEESQCRGRSFGGLLFGHQIGATIGRNVADLELIAVASAATEWHNVEGYLPF